MNERSFLRVPTLDLGKLALTASAIILLLAVNKLGLPGNIVFFAILIGMIATSPEMAFKAYSLSFLGLVMNQALVLKTPVWTIARFVIPALCLARFIVELKRLRVPLMRPRFFAALVAFVAVAAILSIMTNYFVLIALLKLFNFAIGSFAILYGVKAMAHRRADLIPWFVAIVLAVVMLGLATIPLGIAYNFRGSLVAGRGLFNGPFYHSNCTGPMSALMAVLMASVVVFGPYRQRWICLPLAACLVFFMVLTQSRTSFGALLVGLGTVVVASLLLDRQGLLKLRMRVSRFALVGLVAMASILALGYDLGTDQQLTKALITFAQKGKESETLSVEDVLASRQGMIDYMWANFLDSPMIGIGFEVSTHPYFAENATLFNAPIEKGFLPVAILEETRLVGTFFFVIFLLALAVNLIRTLNVPGLALFFAFLAVNCGESMFFSLGGHGAYGWLMMAAGMMLGQQSIVRIGTPLHSVNAAPPVAALQRTMMPTYGA